jgi:HK97 family phage prohead protease
MDRLNCALEIKFAGDTPAGEFEGYASVFGGLDSYGDQIAPGAFTRTLAERKASGRQLPMYFQHGRILGADPRPVGVWKSVEEDGRGLKVSGKLVGLDTETGKYNLALIKEGAMRGLSIGYRAKKADYPKEAGKPRRILRDVDLGEVSVVDDPADASAIITGVKAAQSVRTIREFEDWLRDVGGYSHAAAKAITAGGFKASTEPRDEDGTAELRSYAERFRALRPTT